MTDVPKLRVTDAAVKAGFLAAGSLSWVSLLDTRKIIEAAIPHLKPEPELPTEPGSVVLVSRLAGQVLDPPVPLLLSDLHGSYPWLRATGTSHTIASGDIEEWAPAKVTAVGEDA